MFQVPCIFPYSKINHSRTTEFYYENGTVEVLQFFCFCSHTRKKENCPSENKACVSGKARGWKHMCCVYVCMGTLCDDRTDFKTNGKDECKLFFKNKLTR